MIVVLLANGFEELEALTPVDILRRKGVDVRTVGIDGRTVTGSHGITVLADMTAEEVDLDMVEAAIFPGGMPGALNLDASPFTDKVISKVNEKGGWLAAICAAPLVLGRRGLLKGKKATCYPGFEEELIGATHIREDVVTDGNITTACGMAASLAFANEIVRIVSGECYDREILAEIDKAAQKFTTNACPSKNKDDDADSSSYYEDQQFLDAVEIAIRAEKISTSLLQRRLQIGFGKAARFIDTMEELGIVSGPNGQKPRDVLINMEQWHEILSRVIPD